MTFWRHVKRGTTSEIGSPVVGGGETEISQFHSLTLVGDQNVLGFQITVIDSNGMAIEDSVQDLQEGVLGEGVVSNVTAMIRDV
jgi:hypothetical protein